MLMFHLSATVNVIPPGQDTESEQVNRRSTKPRVETISGRVERLPKYLNLV